ncbi:MULTISPECIES: serine hydrolase domain-containing protein [unclassified Nonomuraea]|uniref:serine hydrolase domain-containing protein n=1 Tax=unclassified Nonomuraea TaxID=2593643 RepID=UPI0033D076FD
MLKVAGRRTGNLTSVPVAVTRYRGADFLVSMLGRGTGWVRDVRAAGGRAALHCKGHEVPILLEILRPLKMRGTMVAGNRTQLPGPHAHGYYRYEEDGRQKTVDISRQNLSLLADAGDLISTTQDLATFISALNGGKLLPPNLLAEMRKPHPKMGYGLGLFVQDLGPDCGTVYQHNGSPPHGYGAFMYSSPDGSKTLTASVTWVDEATRGPAKDYQKLVDRLVQKVFCGRQTAD